MHTHPRNKLKKFKQTSAYQKADGNCFWDRKGELMVTFMQQAMSEVYCETLKNCVGPFRTKGVEC
jgi:hypothetical protein